LIIFRHTMTALDPRDRSRDRQGAGHVFNENALVQSSLTKTRRDPRWSRTAAGPLLCSTRLFA
jgi:hypothetical protein